MEDVPEDGPPLEEEAAGGVDGDGVGGDLALGDEGLGGGLQVALHQVVIDVDVEHLIGLPVGPRHGLIDLCYRSANPANHALPCSPQTRGGELLAS